MAATFQRLQPAGQRRVGTGFESGDPERSEAAMPKDDANANKSFFGPGGLLKGAGSGRFKTGLDANRTTVQTAGRFQKVRRSRK